MGDLSFTKLRGLLKEYEHFVEEKDKRSKFGMYQPKDMHFRALVAYGWASDFLNFAQKILSDQHKLEKKYLKDDKGNKFEAKLGFLKHKR